MKRPTKDSRRLKTQATQPSQQHSEDDVRKADLAFQQLLQEEEAEVKKKNKGKKKKGKSQEEDEAAAAAAAAAEEARERAEAEEEEREREEERQRVAERAAAAAAKEAERKEREAAAAAAAASRRDAHAAEEGVGRGRVGSRGGRGGRYEGPGADGKDAGRGRGGGERAQGRDGGGWDTPRGTRGGRGGAASAQRPARDFKEPGRGVGVGGGGGGGGGRGGERGQGAADGAGAAVEARGTGTPRSSAGQHHASSAAQKPHTPRQNSGQQAPSLPSAMDSSEAPLVGGTWGGGTCRAPAADVVDVGGGGQAHGPELQLDAASMPAAPSVWGQKQRERVVQEEQARTQTAPWSPGAAGDQVKQKALSAAAEPFTTLQAAPHAAPHADTGAAGGAGAAGAKGWANDSNCALPRAGTVPAGAVEHVDMQDGDCSLPLHHVLHPQNRLLPREDLPGQSGRAGGESQKGVWNRGAGGNPLLAPSGSGSQGCNLIGIAENVSSLLVTCFTCSCVPCRHVSNVVAPTWLRGLCG